MDADTFWRLLDATLGQPDRPEALREQLTALDSAQIVAFRLAYDDAMQKAYTVDLSAACHHINGSATDDVFSEFRDGLIERGRAVFEAAVRDPDSLADLVGPGTPLLGTDHLAFVADTAWVQVTGGTVDQFFAAVDEADTAGDRGAAETGEWWPFDDPAEFRHRLPRLAAKYLPG